MKIAVIGAGNVGKAFNVTGSGDMENPKYGDLKADMFICGDDKKAKGMVTSLAEELGFSVVDAGPLDTARLLEAVALLWINIAYEQKLGPDIALKFLRR